MSVTSTAECQSDARKVTSVRGYLTPTMQELTRKLMERYPTGPLFRNGPCKPWTLNAIRCRFQNLRARLPHLRGVVSYKYRPSLVTDALENNGSKHG